MKLSIVSHEDKGISEIYTLETRNGLKFDIILSHEHHQTIIFDYQRELIIEEIYGVYLSVALNELKQYLNLFKTFS